MTLNRDELAGYLNEDQEIPPNVREKLDLTYDAILIKSKKKKQRSIWKATVLTAACTVLTAGILFSNENVKAGLSSFMNFDDNGILLALNKGFVEKPNSSSSTEDVRLKLVSYFSDSSKIGLNIEVTDPSLIKGNVEEVSLDYRLKNGDGEYIAEAIVDTKPLKSNNKYLAGVEDKNLTINTKSGFAKYDVVLDSTQASFPKLDNAVLEVETVKVFYSDGTLRKTEGHWNLALGENKQKFTPVKYIADDKNAEVKILSAAAYPTSLSVSFAYNPDKVDDHVFYHNVKLIDNNGREYIATSFSVEKKKDQTILSTNFPISSFANAKDLRFVVKGLKEVKLVRK